MEKAEVDCVYAKKGSCEDCTLPENEKCPYEDESKDEEDK